MSLHAFKMGVNVVSFIKNNKMYGMSCAWASQVGYEEIILTIGSQSVTGKVLEIGDVIGVSALNSEQEHIAMQFGTSHSDTSDKFKGIDFVIDGSAILINNASRMMKVEVIDIMHLKGIEEDNVVYCKVLSSIENGNDFYEYK